MAKCVAVSGEESYDPWGEVDDELDEEFDDSLELLLATLAGNQWYAPLFEWDVETPGFTKGMDIIDYFKFRCAMLFKKMPEGLRYRFRITDDVAVRMLAFLRKQELERITAVEMSLRDVCLGVLDGGLSAIAEIDLEDISQPIDIYELKATDEALGVF